MVLFGLKLFEYEEGFVTIRKGNTIKLVLSGHSKINKTNVLKTDGSLIQVESIADTIQYRLAPLEHSAILMTCIKLPSVLKTNFGLLLSGCSRQVLLYE